MRKSCLSVAILFAATSVVAQGQTVLSTFTENFEDGLAVSRWDFVARETLVDPASATPDGSINFAFDYTSTTFTNYGNANSQDPIGAAPSGAGFKGALMHVNDNDATARIAQAGMLPKTVGITGDYRMTLDMFANNSDPAASGSSEFALIGLNADAVVGSVPNLIVGDNLPAGAATPAIAANATAVGYAFASSTEGGFAGDYRVYARKLPGDDAPRFQKRNASWTGTTRVPLFDSGGNYQGVETNPEEAFNPYYYDLSPGNKNGPFLGGVGKSWVQVGVQQRGSIVTYTLNGKIINTLFVPTPVGGRVQIGAYDAASSVPANTAESYFLFDNVKIDTLGPAAPNTISASDDFARMNAGGTVTINGAASLTGLQFDTAATTLDGTGAITFGGSNGAIYAGGGVSHVLSKPLTINAATAIYVDTPTDKLTISNATWGPGVVFNKEGQGTLEINRLNAKAAEIISGKVKLGTGVNKLNLLYFEYQPADPTAGNEYSPATVNSGVLDINRSIVAVDYTNAPLAAGAGTTPQSPFVRLQGRVFAGFRADLANGGIPRWDGAGIITSSPDLLGANFATSTMTIRITEASTIGYADGATLGNTGVAIDATTVLLGYTFKADTNMDQSITFDDLLKLAQNYGLDYTGNIGTTGVQWWLGDSNGDGLVNFDDLLALAQAYGSTVSLIGVNTDMSMHNSFESDWQLALSIAPEPTSLAALAMGGLLIRRRR